jgi:hypothetical protein
MVTTLSRQRRRAALQPHKVLIDSFLHAYEINPRAALETSWATFGRKEFEKILERYLQKHCIQNALSYTIRECIQKEKNNGKSN